jgi:hypothetical protein
MASAIIVLPLAFSIGNLGDSNVYYFCYAYTVKHYFYLHCVKHLPDWKMVKIKAADLNEIMSYNNF